MGFYKLTDKLEIGSRYGIWDPGKNSNNDVFGNIAVGTNYSPNPEHWKDMMFKLAATFKISEEENQPYDPFIVHFVWQVYMH